MKTLRRTSALAAVTILVGLSLSACGNNGSSAPGARAESGSLTEATFVSTLAEAQSKAQSSHVTMALDLAGQSLTAEGDVLIGSTVADSALAMTMDTGSMGMGTLELRLVDETVYLNIGPLTQGKFAKIDLTDESNPIGQQYGKIAGQLNPAKQLEQFGQALTSLEKKGDPVSIEGVQAQPYVVTVDTAKIVDKMDLPGDGAQQVPATIQYTVFVGPDDLPRRIVSDVAGSTITVNYTRWGDEVTIAAPPAGQISDADVLSQLGGFSTT